MSFLDSREASAASGIGKSVPRREDARLLTGRGQYAADFNLPGQAFAYVLRSPRAHAKIVAIDTAPAAGIAGVLAVLIGTDAVADGIGPIPHNPVPANPHEVPLKSRDGSPFFIAPHPILAVDRWRYVGEPIAIVVAETLSQAVDAAERLQVRYETLPSVTRSENALAPGAPPVWTQHGSNLCVDTEAGDKDRTEAAFAQAAYVVTLETMELRAALGAYDPVADKFTV